MTYMDFEKEYIKDRPTEPYSENEDASDWANIAHYAEDNLQRAFNLGYCECFHKAKNIIEKLLVFIPNKNEYFQQVSDDIRLIAEKFIEVGKMKLNIRQLIERLSLNINDIILEVFEKDVIVFNSFWDDTDIEKYLKKKVKYFIAHYDSKNYGDKYVLTVNI